MAYTKTNHAFTFPELEWDSTENYQPCIKLSFFFKKLPHVDATTFQKHYNHVHADLTVACKSFNVYKIQRYVQLIQTPEMKNKVEALGMQLLDYDACSTLWVRSWEDWERFSSSEEYAAALMSDADHFMDYKTHGIKVMAGHDLIVFGKAVPECDGKDGITRS